MNYVKVKISKFLGTYDLESYLDWEMKVDKIFNYNNFSEENKMQLASLEFEGQRKIGKTKSGHLGGKSVDNYYKEMEISLIRRNIEETNAATKKKVSKKNLRTQV